MNKIFTAFFLLILISCDSANEATVENTDTIVVEQEKDAEPKWREQLEEESKALEQRLDTLEKRLDSVTGATKQQTQEAIDRLRRKKEEVLSDTATGRVKTQWIELKKSVKDLSDSISKNF